MKKTLALVALTFLSSSVFAKSEPASTQERQMLCAAIDAYTEQITTDFALDKASCLKDSEMDSELISEGTRIVVGTVTFNYPAGYSSELLCYAAYTGEAKVANIIGGLVAGVVCRE